MNGPNKDATYEQAKAAADMRKGAAQEVIKLLMGFDFRPHEAVAVLRLAQSTIEGYVNGALLRDCVKRDMFLL